MGRKKPKIIAVPHKWQICTEGATEANYLKEYIEAKDLGRHVIVNCKDAANKGCGRQHEALLDKMQECGRKWNPERVKVFLVHDYDKAAEDSDTRKSFNRTFDRARKESGFFVIYSNPCFEYWLLLHNDYVESILHRHLCQEKVRDFCNQKLKESKLPLFQGDTYKVKSMFKFFGGVSGSEQARRNARKRFGKTDESYSSAKHAKKTPCTNLIELLDALDELSVSVHDEKNRMS